jgi:hypothetical protein
MGRMSITPRKAGSTVQSTITPLAAAITGWMPVRMSTPVCRQFAPVVGQILRIVPLHRRHGLPTERPRGCHVGSGNWK